MSTLLNISNNDNTLSNRSIVDIWKKVVKQRSKSVDNPFEDLKSFHVFNLYTVSRSAVPNSLYNKSINNKNHDCFLNHDWSIHDDILSWYNSEYRIKDLDQEANVRGL